MNRLSKGRNAILRALTADEYRSAPQVIQATGLAQDTVYDYLVEMVKKGHVERIRRPRPAGIRVHRPGLPIVMPPGPPVEWAYRLMD